MTSFSRDQKLRHFYLISIDGDLFEALEALWERVIKWPDDGGFVNNDRLEWPDVSGRHDHIPLDPPALNCEWQTLATGPKKVFNIKPETL